MFRQEDEDLAARLTTVPAAIKYFALVSFLASNSLGEVLFGNSQVSVNQQLHNNPIYGGT